MSAIAAVLGRRHAQMQGLLRRLMAAWLLLTLAAGAPALAFESPIRIGVLTPAWGSPGGLDGLIKGLVELGYRENEDFVVGVRFTRGDLSALPAAARAMVELGVDVILADSEPAARAMQEATSTHPIIFLGAGDPVGRGLISSFNHPGGNVTGVTDLDLEISGKRLQLFKELVPGLQQVLFPHDENDKYVTAQAEAYRIAARRLNLNLVALPVSTEDEARGRLADFSTDEIDGLLTPEDVGLNIPGVVLEFAQANGIPSMFASAVYLVDGGFASYGGARDAMGRQAARLVDKVVRGSYPAEIPVETAQRLELVVNLETARRLGLEVPRVVLFQADRIIR